MNLSQRLRLVSLDKKQWQRLYYKNQQAYIRQRLSAIRYLSEGKSRAEVAKLVGCTDLTIARWIGKYLDTGLEGLVEPIKHQVRERLNPLQQQETKEMVLNDRPTFVWNRARNLDRKNYSIGNKAKMGSRFENIKNL